MGQIRDWRGMREMSARLLNQRTGEDLDTWNRRSSGKAWLTRAGFVVG